MCYTYLLTHSPTHLPDILGSGWVSDTLAGAPHVVPSEGLILETTADADDVTTGRCLVQLPRSTPVSGDPGWI